MTITHETTEYCGWKNCIRLTNGVIEIMATTEVGPRILRCGFVNGPNLFAEFDEHLGKTGGEDWRIYGGHRLWHAPEARPRTYHPDNEPVKWEVARQKLVLTQKREPKTGIVKKLRIAMDANRPLLRVTHVLRNESQWPIRLAPWALSVMAPGGFAIVPHEPFLPHTEYLLPTRPLALWPYTNMADPRVDWGERVIILRQDEKMEKPIKFGLRSSRGWTAYANGGNVLIKRISPVLDRELPDMGCNFELFADSRMLEVESLGPLVTVAPNGGRVEHLETWHLARAEFAPNENEAIENLAPILNDLNLPVP